MAKEAEIETKKFDSTHHHQHSMSANDDSIHDDLPAGAQPPPLPMRVLDRYSVAAATMYSFGLLRNDLVLFL